jgi:hypothetical protein
MNTRVCSVFAGLCGVAVFALSAIPSGAQATEVKEKPAMYSYVANWTIPAEHWGDVAKINAFDNTIFQAALSDGTLVGYGNDVNMVHTPDGESHDTWWSATSLAGLLKVLDKLRGVDPSNSPHSLNPTKHWDLVLVGHYYNWKPGAYTGAYVNVAMYQLKPNADDDAVSTLSKSVVVPMLENCRCRSRARWTGSRRRRRRASRRGLRLRLRGGPRRCRRRPTKPVRKSSYSPVAWPLCMGRRMTS